METRPAYFDATGTRGTLVFFYVVFFFFGRSRSPRFLLLSPSFLSPAALDAKRQKLDHPDGETTGAAAATVAN